MATRDRKKPARKKPAKKTASKITEAQKAAVERRLERDTLRAQSSMERARLTGKARTQEAARTGEIRGPEKKKNVGTSQPYSVAGGDPLPSNAVANPSLSDAGNKIAGLVTNLRQVRAEAAATPQQPLANPDLYGTGRVNTLKRLNEFMAAQAEQKNLALKNKGQAVYMGAQRNKAKIRNRGPQRMDELGQDYTETPVGETYLSKAELMSWLTDPTKVDQIMAAAQKAGLELKDYDDVSKLWGSVVDMAADSYSLAGKKVTPWALIQLRGKYAKNGRPADRVTTTTNIDEMEPETARLMFEQTAQNALGRAPTKSEVDDFIAKAQTIAKQNPTVTKTTQKIGFDGNVESTVNETTGGGAQDKAQVAAMDQAKQSEDYASFQAAGNYFPMLFDALKSPV